MLTANEPCPESQELSQARQLLEWAELDTCEQRMAAIAGAVGADRLGSGDREHWRQVRRLRVRAEQQYSARCEPLPLFQRWPRALRDACRLLEGSRGRVACANVEWRTERLLEEWGGPPAVGSTPETMEYVAGLLTTPRTLGALREKLDVLVALHEERVVRPGR